MSRTKRKHKYSLNHFHGKRVVTHHEFFIRNYFLKSWMVGNESEPTFEESKREYESETKGGNWIDHTVPKSHRKIYNKKRRRKDKREIWREINLEDYEGQCSDWNCKDAHVWDFW